MQRSAPPLVKLPYLPPLPRDFFPPLRTLPSVPGHAQNGCAQGPKSPFHLQPTGVITGAGEGGGWGSSGRQLTARQLSCLDTLLTSKFWEYVCEFVYTHAHAHTCLLSVKSIMGLVSNSNELRQTISFCLELLKSFWVVDEILKMDTCVLKSNSLLPHVLCRF